VASYQPCAAGGVGHNGRWLLASLGCPWILSGFLFARLLARSLTRGPSRMGPRSWHSNTVANIHIQLRCTRDFWQTPKLADWPSHGNKGCSNRVISSLAVRDVLCSRAADDTNDPKTIPSDRQSRSGESQPPVPAGQGGSCFGATTVPLPLSLLGGKRHEPRHTLCGCCPPRQYSCQNNLPRAGGPLHL
jgi:hypothetical protein